MNAVESERIVHVPAYEYIEVVVRNVYECPDCVTDDDRPVRKTAKFNGKAPEDYLRCLFEQAPYAETESDWEKLLPWNIEITPFQIRGEWMDLANQG